MDRGGIVAVPELQRLRPGTGRGRGGGRGRALRRARSRPRTRARREHQDHEKEAEWGANETAAIGFAFQDQRGHMRNLSSSLAELFASEMESKRGLAARTE